MTLSFLDSPRLRRRLAWAASLCAVAGAAAVAVVLLQKATPGPEPERFSAEPLYIPAEEPEVRLRREDRRRIDETLDRFIPAAVERRDPAAAYDLATPSLRGGLTRQRWAAGAIPVYPFDTRLQRFHDWLLNYSTPRAVGLDLMLPAQERGATGVVVTVELRRFGSRWLVDSVQPTATFAAAEQPARVRAQPDFAPPTQGSGGGALMGSARRETAESRLAAGWLALPLAFLGLLIAAGAGVLGANALRSRHMARALRG